MNIRKFQAILTIFLAICLFSTITNVSEFSKADNWIEKAKKAAEQGDVITQTRLGRMYYWGQGVERDYKEAFNWYRKSAEQGNAKAQHMLAEMYYEGQGV